MCCVTHWCPQLGLLSPPLVARLSELSSENILTIQPSANNPIYEQFLESGQQFSELLHNICSSAIPQVSDSLLCKCFTDMTTMMLLVRLEN